MIARAFYTDNSDLIPASGGQLIEGSVGSLPPDYNLNPLFADGITADISNLIFAGLMRYDPDSGEIRDYLATHTLSEDKKTYEFTLVDDLFWQDGEPVTTDDILFTFRDIVQHPDFPSDFLKSTFADVVISATDEKTVRFTIPDQRKTFFTNFTIGLLPRHLLAGVPVADLALDSFNQSPIGCGPYRFEGAASDSSFSEVTLSAFPDFFLGPPKIEKISFRIFPNIENLVANADILDAIRPMMTRDTDIIPNTERFQKIETISPRYLAIFFNLKNEQLGSKKVRQAMRAALDTDAISKKEIGNRVDTPIVELWPQNDIVNISTDRAAEILTEAGYIFQDAPTAPEKKERMKYFFSPSDENWSATSENDFYLRGKVPEGTQKVVVNDYELKLFSPQKGEFSYRTSTRLGTLETGKNIFTADFFNSSEEKIDSESIEIFYHSDPGVIEKMNNTRDGDSVSPEADDQDSPEEDVHEKKWRINNAGEHLKFTLVFLDGLDYLREISEESQKSWEALGIEIVLQPLSANDLREKMRNRDYELMLLPQHLGYNLDLYPYFHLSEAGENGFNISGWKSLEASVLLEEIRSTHEAEKRFSKLERLRDLMIDEVPAFFLYTPRYTWLVDSHVKNIVINHMATLPDRFSNADRFYVRTDRQFSEEKNLSDFGKWFVQNLKNTFLFSSSL